MPCTTEIVSIETLSDAEIVVTLRCCGDPKTDSKHTINLMTTSDQTQTGTLVARTPQELQALIQEQIVKSEERHTTMQTAVQNLQTLKATLSIAT